LAADAQKREEPGGAGSRDRAPAPAPGERPAPRRGPLEAAVATVLARQVYRRERHYFDVRFVLGALAVAALALAQDGWNLLRPEKHVYFATSPDGRIMNLTPVGQPNGTDDAVLAFAAEAVTRAWTFSFMNYEREFQDAAAYFTKEGWEANQAALVASGNLDAVVRRRFVLVARLDEAPLIENKGQMSDGRYGWVVSMAVRLQYQGQTAAMADKLVPVTALVVRRPETENPRGLGVAQINFALR
jgi:intracellular multiplication protein IcmL